MKSRTVILLTAFIIASILGGAFVYVYHQFGNEIVRRYVEKITNCGIISDESVCSEKKFCEGIYGLLDDTSDKVEFLKCRKIPFNRLAGMEHDFNLCQNTGGRWYENRLGKFCLCDELGSSGTFNKEKGCVPK